jgi:hypothetical protein
MNRPHRRLQAEVTSPWLGDPIVGELEGQGSRRGRRANRQNFARDSRQLHRTHRRRASLQHYNVREPGPANNVVASTGKSYRGSFRGRCECEQILKATTLANQLANDVPPRERWTPWGMWPQEVRRTWTVGWVLEHRSK